MDSMTSMQFLWYVIEILPARRISASRNGQEKLYHKRPLTKVHGINGLIDSHKSIRGTRGLSGSERSLPQSKTALCLPASNQGVAAKI